MSHFSVLVIGGNVEKQLAPFQENNMGNCPQEFMKFRIWDKEGEDHWFDDEKQALESGIERDPDEGEGNWENPEARWDWIQVGGRWTGFFKLAVDAMAAIDRVVDLHPKPGDKEIFDAVDVGEPGIQTTMANRGYCDQARRCDIDWSAMREERKQSAIQTWEEAENDEKRKDDLGYRYFVYGIEKDETKEQYIERCTLSAGITFAIVKDGQWYEKGKMGWFGCASDEKDEGAWNSEYAKLIDSLPADTLLTIVDCHI